MKDFWDRYATFVERRRGTILLSALAIAAAAGFCASHLDLRTDFSELLPRKAEAVKQLERLQQRLGGVSTLVVAIEGGDWKQRESFAEETVAALKAKLPRGHFDFIDYEIKSARGFYERNQFLYADLKDLEEVRDRLKRAIEDAVKKETVVQLDDEKPYQFDVEDLKKKYQARVAEYDHFPDGYFITPDRTLQTLLLRIPSSSLGETSTDQIIDEVRAVTGSLHPEARGYKILIGGDPVSAQDERRGLIEDLAVVSGSSVFLVIFCMILYYRSKRCLVLIGSPVAVGTLVAFAVAELAIGSINSNTAFLGSIIIGNGINFGIILLARYLEERRGGSDAHSALRASLSNTWVGTATAAMAASMAYGSLMVTDFRGFSQFGFIGGVGMIACWISTYTVMPALISLLESRWPILPKQKQGSRGPALVQSMLKWSTPIALGGVAVTIVSLLGAAHFYRDPFEYDFRKLRANNSQKTGASALGRRVDRIFDGTKMSAGSPAVVLADRPDQVEPLVNALEEKKKNGAFIDRAEWIRGLLPRDQEKKIAVLDEIRELLDHKVLGALNEKDRKEAEQYRPRENLKPIQVEDLPEMVTRPYLEKNGQKGLIVYVYPPPHSDMMIGKELLKFAAAIVETRLPNGEVIRTSGHEVVLADILHEILTDGPKATLASFVGVLILVMLAFRKMRDRALVLISLVVGVTWMCGAAAALGIKINMLNFVALPITFGIGVEYPTNVYRRYLADGRKDLARAVWSTGSAVALCSLTTIIGYGSLLFADTRALNSFGLLAVVGEVTTLVAALVWLPSLVKKEP